MKQLALILAAIPFLALPAFPDVAVLTGSGGGTFETILCPTPSTCGLFSEVGEEVDVDAQGNVVNVVDLGENLSGPSTWIFDSNEAILPAGSIVTGGSVTVNVESSPSGTPGFVLSGDSTVNSLNFGIACDGAPPAFFNFTGPDAKSITGSFTPCSGQDIQVVPIVSGNASLSGFVDPFPTDPGDHIYLGTLSQTFNYTIDLDYTVPGEAPEPSEFLPLGLAGIALIVWRRLASSASGKNCTTAKIADLL
jgi:hypothetical protein